MSNSKKKGKLELVTEEKKNNPGLGDIFYTSYVTYPVSLFVFYSCFTLFNI